MDAKQIAKLRELCEQIPDNVLGNSDSAYVGISYEKLADLLNALPEALDEIERLREANRQLTTQDKNYKKLLEDRHRYREALKEIANKESWSQRPGGSQSEIERIARKALEES